METIDVCMTSWPNHPDRIVYLRDTIEAMKEFMLASQYELKFYLSAESERDPKSTWHGDELVGLCEEHCIPMQWRDEPANLGANMNAAMMMGSGDFVYLQQDDWTLTKPLDLSDGATLLGSSEIDIVRYSWPDNDAMRPTFRVNVHGIGDFREIEMKGRWPYGDDPHLRNRSFMDKWGWYCEGGKHGTASGALMRDLVRGNAFIVAADKVYYEHRGRVSAVVGDTRNGKNRRYE